MYFKEGVKNIVCSLREAITAANTNQSVDACPAGSRADSINFSVFGNITLQSALPDIEEDLKIIGPGATRLVIVGPSSGLRQIVNAGVTLNLRSVTMTGHCCEGFIRNDGTLSIDKSNLTNNFLELGPGGAIRNNGILKITNSTFSGNEISFGLGSAIFNDVSGQVTIVNSLFSDNESIDVAGGAIYNLGMVSITGSTFVKNLALSFGGAIYNGPSGIMNTTNSTFSGNEAYIHGGGIYNSGTIEITNSTFTGNGGLDFVGDGIFNSGSATLRNTIVANSLPGNVNCSGMMTDGGGNLTWPDTTCPGLNGDPLLRPLGNNGGPTRTHALLPGSPAIDNGVNTYCPAEDQRGLVRPTDGDKDGIAICDIGAFEVQP